jgi:hypothetical protein
MHLSLLTNNEMASREQFKINGAALTNFPQTLKKRDELLLMRNAELLKRTLKLKKVLGLNVEFSSPSQTLKNAMEEFQKVPGGS